MKHRKRRMPLLLAVFFIMMTISAAWNTALPVRAAGEALPAGYIPAKEADCWLDFNNEAAGLYAVPYACESDFYDHYAQVGEQPEDTYILSLSDTAPFELRRGGASCGFSESGSVSFQDYTDNSWQTSDLAWTTVRYITYTLDYRYAVNVYDLKWAGENDSWEYNPFSAGMTGSESYTSVDTYVGDTKRKGDPMSGKADVKPGGVTVDLIATETDYRTGRVGEETIRYLVIRAEQTFDSTEDKWYDTVSFTVYCKVLGVLPADSTDGTGSTVGGNTGDQDPYDYGGGTVQHEWVYDDDAEKKGGAEVGKLLPPAAAAVLVGGAVIGSKKKKAKKAAEEEKKRQEEEKISYAIRIYKSFGDTLVSGTEPQPVYARIVKIDAGGRETTDARLTSLIQISSPDYLQVTDRQRAGEYIGAFVSVPEDNNGKPLPAEAVVAFTVQANGGRFTERLHFKIEAGAEIVFFQENLGLPAHYEKEARLLFYAGNVPAGAEVRASLVYASTPYEVRLEPHPEEPGFWYAVLRDIRPNDKGEPGDTREWALRAEVVGADGKTRKESTIPIFRIHLGLSLLLEGSAVGCYLKASDRRPAMTAGRLLLLEWDEETQQIVRVAPVWKPEDWTVKAERAVNNAKAGYGMSDQERVDALGIMAIPANEIDDTGAQVFYLTTTKAALDRPTRVWSEVSVRVRYNGREYTASKRVLLHSMPFRQFESSEQYAAADKADQKIFEQLMSIRARIMPTYYNNLFSLYDLIDRMTDGYDIHFGYDQNQIDNVMDIWVGFLEGRKTGANADAERLTLADDLSAAYAFLEGMRDNGGLLGRIALGVCTAGYSETVFFAMDLYEKMETAVNSCSGDEFGFWDGVVMGVKEYEISLAQELLLKGAFKGANKAIGHLTGVDVGKTVAQNYSRFIGNADKALRANSTLYAKSAKALDSMTAFTNGSAKSLADARKQSADARAAAEQRVDTKLGSEKLSVAERRQGMKYKDLTPEQMERVIDYDLAMEDGMNKVRALDQARKNIRRGSPDYWEQKAEYEKRVFEVLDDPNAKKQLRALGGSEGLSNRAELNRVRKEFQQAVQERFLDNCAERTGRPRGELYVQSVSSNKAADELAGKTLSEDWDVTGAQEVRSDRARDIIIGQTVGEEELARAVYETRFGKEPPDLAAAKQLCETMDITYVSPGMDYGYVIEHNPEAYFELGKMIDKSKYGTALSSPTMARLTIEHKAKEHYQRGDAFYREAYRLEAEAAAIPSPEARTEILERARKLRSRGQGAYVEGTRQLKKTVDNIADARNDYRVSRGEGDLFTPEHRELQALDRRVGSREPDEICPEVFFMKLESDYGLDKYGLADKMAETFA